METWARWSTRTRVLLLLTLVLILFFFVVVTAQRSFLLPVISKIERDAAQRDMERVLRAFKNEAQFLDAFCRDWAYWDDMYGFATAPTAAFIESNFSESVTVNTGVDVFAVFNTAGELIFSASYRGAAAFSADVEQQLSRNGVLMQRLVQPLLRADVAADHGSSGILRLGSLPVMAAARPILNSQRLGPATGVLVMARVIDEAQQERLRAQTLVPFSVQMQALTTPVNAERLLAQDGQVIWLANSDNNEWQLASALTELRGENMVLRFSFPREISAYAERMFALVVLGLAVAVMLLGITLFWLLTRAFLQPLGAMAQTVHGIEQQRDLSLRLPESGAVELQKVARAFNGMMAELERFQAEVTVLSLTDALTELPNRRMFEQVIQREWQLAQRNKQPLAVLMCDIDEFKHYNDHYGHQHGDIILREVAKALRIGLRRVSDVVARYGGEEFVLILPDTNVAGARLSAERLLATVRGLAIAHEASATAGIVTISVGVAVTYPCLGQDHESLLQRADHALYAAKNAGRNRYCEADAE